MGANTQSTNMASMCICQKLISLVERLHGDITWGTNSVQATHGVQILVSAKPWSTMYWLTGHMGANTRGKNISIQKSCEYKGE